MCVQTIHRTGKCIMTTRSEGKKYKCVYMAILLCHKMETMIFPFHCKIIYLLWIVKTLKVENINFTLFKSTFGNYLDVELVQLN